MLYFIKLRENKVSLLEYDYNMKKFVTKKNNGEEWQEFHEDYFWQWFKKKIAYDNEPLSFIIDTDVPISIDSSLRISEKNAFEEYIEDIVPFLDTFDTLIKIPDFEINFIEEKTENMPPKSNPPKKNSFAHYAKMKRER